MTVTVCIPVWNGAAFVKETLASVAQQTFDDLKINISVDKSDDRSLEIARAFAASEPRAQLFVQTTRLGWIGNVNYLLRNIASEFAAILPHDDVLAPSYYEKLVAKLEAHPEAILAYSDIETFGDSNHVLIGPEVVGKRLTRILDFLQGKMAAIAYRGVFRTKVLDKGCYLEEESGTAADQTWLLRLAIDGDLVRVAEPLYRKRLHEASVCAIAMDSHWADHCVACQRIALAAGPWTLSQRWAISAAVLFRATRHALREVASSLLFNIADFLESSLGWRIIGPLRSLKSTTARLLRKK